MVLEAKKEQMDTLLRELQSLKEAQLRKGIILIAVSQSPTVQSQKLVSCCTQVLLEHSREKNIEGKSFLGRMWQ